VANVKFLEIVFEKKGRWCKSLNMLNSVLLIAALVPVIYAAWATRTQQPIITSVS
jgi:hypothetical protein